jgi:UrcA family protein
MTSVNRIACFVLLASFTGLAFGAVNGGNPPQRTVNYADLDLTRKAGAETLLVRIKSAARAVCERPHSLEMTFGTPYRQCVDDAIGRAVADVNAPVLAQVYRKASVQ